jgi:hypothetical protein
MLEHKRKLKTKALKRESVASKKLEQFNVQALLQVRKVKALKG